MKTPVHKPAKPGLTSKLSDMIAPDLSSLDLMAETLAALSRARAAFNAEGKTFTGDELPGWVRDHEPVLFDRWIEQVQDEDMYQALAVERATSGVRAIVEGLVQIERDIADRAGDEKLLEAMRCTARVIRRFLGEKG